MLLVRKETVFSIRELRHVSITCPYCKTEVVLDMQAHEPSGPGPVRERIRFAPIQCPSCQVRFDTALSGLENLRSAYAALSQLGDMISFRVAQED